MKTKLFLGLITLSSIVFANLACDEDSSAGPEVTGASGTITLENIAAWPDSGDVLVTLWGENVWTANGPILGPAGVVILTKVPGQTQYEFSFEGISAGSYSAISVGWRFPDETLDSACRSVTLGVYINDASVASTGLIFQGAPPPFQGPLPEVVTVEENKTTRDLDLKADFGIMPIYIAVLKQPPLNCPL